MKMGALPPNPRGLALCGQNGWTTMKVLERRIGQRRGATRAPAQAPEWQGVVTATPQHRTRRSLIKLIAREKWS